MATTEEEISTGRFDDRGVDFDNYNFDTLALHAGSYPNPSRPKHPDVENDAKRKLTTND